MSLKTKMGKKAKNKKRAIIISVTCILLAFPLIIFPVSTVIIYEAVFGMSYETEPWLAFSVDEFDGLYVERSDFRSEGTTLAGYKYFKNDQDIKGVVVISHGMGSGHARYMPFINVFASNGYYVFAYDAHGTDNSGGDSVEGLPQGIVDLDSALHHVASISDYKGLPVALFGHSWGAYSAGNVLNTHPEVRSAAICAGFNESEDLLEYQGTSYVGPGGVILMPYFELYERIKFGKKYADMTAIDGMKKTEANIMVVHSKDDSTVPSEFGYDKFHSEFSDNDRFEFVSYEDRGHSYLFYSDEARAYREQLNADYTQYIEDNGLKYNSENKEAFMRANLDKKKCFDPDPELMRRVIEMFDNGCLRQSVYSF